MIVMVMVMALPHNNHFAAPTLNPLLCHPLSVSHSSLSVPAASFFGFVYTVCVQPSYPN